MRTTHPTRSWPLETSSGARLRLVEPGSREPERPNEADAPEDAVLVEQVRNGSRSAMETLYRRHAPFAIHLATRIEGSARDVEDIVHDSFIRVHERIHDLADPGSFRAWLGSIVVHAVRSRMRRTQLMRTLGLVRVGEPVELDAIASSSCSPIVRAQIAQVYALLKTVPVDDRIAWILRTVEGQDLESAAQLLGCSLATVKRRIARTQAFLDEHFVDPTRSDSEAEQ